MHSNGVGHEEYECGGCGVTGRTHGRKRMPKGWSVIGLDISGQADPADAFTKEWSGTPICRKCTRKARQFFFGFKKPLVLGGA